MFNYFSGITSIVMSVTYSTIQEHNIVIHVQENSNWLQKFCYNICIWYVSLHLVKRKFSDGKKLGNTHFFSEVAKLMHSQDKKFKQIRHAERGMARVPWVKSTSLILF